MAKPKLTKKMFADLEKAELREIIVIGMELEPRKAYRFDTAAAIKWIQERATDFADVDLNVLGTDCFRDGVVDYLAKLQKYVLGDSPAPKFPTDDDPQEQPSTEEVIVEEAIVEVAPEPPKKKRGRPRKTPVAETSVETPAPKRGRGRPRKSEATTTATKKKAGFKVKTYPAPKEEAVVKTPKESTSPNPPELVKQEIETTPATNVAVNLSTDMAAFAGFQESVDALRAEVQALRTEQTAAFNLVSDALVYILNNAIIEDDEDVIKDLSQLKK